MADKAKLIGDLRAAFSDMTDAYQKAGDLIEVYTLEAWADADISAFFGSGTDQPDITLDDFKAVIAAYATVAASYSTLSSAFAKMRR